MLTRSALIEPGLIGFGPHVHGLLKFLFESLGVGLLLAPVFAAAALKSRSPIVVFLVAFAIGGILAVSLFHYRASGDMRKFPAASAYALSMLYVLVVDRALIEAPRAWRMVNHAGRMLLVLGGALTAAFLALPMKGAWEPYPGIHGAHPIAPDIQRAVGWLLEHGYEKHQIIYTASANVTDLARSGLSVSGEDWGIRTYGVKRSLFEHQHALLDVIGSSMSRDALRELGVSWILLSDEEMNALGPDAQRALKEDPNLILTARLQSEEPVRTRRIWSVAGTRENSAP
jgi:hypothetical protein